MTTTDFPTQGFDVLLGLTLDEVGPDRVSASFEVRPELHQPYGILHGGVLCSVVETVASVAGAVWFGDRGNVVGSSNTTNFLRATREGVLTAVALPIHRGRSQQLWEVDITDEQDRLVAKGQVRLANLAKAEG
ncbi:MAG: PaaI family thioesterase [Pseudorhodobacter sp.]|nr:PaaI family thioesterase [Frankiaceae bacterium]